MKPRWDRNSSKEAQAGTVGSRRCPGGRSGGGGGMGFARPPINFLHRTHAWTLVV
jgi:hypothetical protein